MKQLAFHFSLPCCSVSLKIKRGRVRVDESGLKLHSRQFNSENSHTNLEQISKISVMRCNDSFGSVQMRLDKSSNSRLSKRIETTRSRMYLCIVQGLKSVVLPQCRTDLGDIYAGLKAACPPGLTEFLCWSSHFDTRQCQLSPTLCFALHLRA